MGAKLKFKPPKKTTKRGQNSKEASKILKESKKQYQKIFKEEIATEKRKSKPNVTQAAKRAGVRYRKVKVTWQQALKKAK